MRKIINKIRKWIVRFLLRLVHNYFDCYVVNLENTNEWEAKAVLFGHNLFCSSENFGSDKGIKIETPYSSYEQLLYESQLKTMVEKMRVLGETEAIVERHFTLVEKYAFGRVYQKPFFLRNYFSELQIQKNIVDINVNFTIHGSVYLEFNMKPKEKFTLLFFGKKMKEVYEASARNY